MPKYVELNTELSTNSATIVDTLNGRQGDNNREVYLWIKNGQSNYDLTNKTVTLEVKDSAGVVKTASTMNDTSGITTGRFSLLIPGMFYQAPGPVMEAFIVIKANDNTTVLSTIPIGFQVIENNIMITQSQSKLYLDGVQQVIDEFNSRFKGASQNLEAMETATKILQQSVDDLSVRIKNLKDTAFRSITATVTPDRTTGLLYYTRVGNLVNVSGTIKPNSNNVSGFIGFVPTGFRPNSNNLYATIRMTTTVDGRSVSIYGMPTTTGTFALSESATEISSTTYTVSGTYTTNDDMPN